MNSIDDVIVCTTNVVAVIVPVAVREPDINTLPLTSKLYPVFALFVLPIAKVPPKKFVPPLYCLIN